MFLGMQGEYICTVSKDREEIENIKDVAGITEIRETNEPVQRINGLFIVGTENIINALKQMRADAYLAEVDPITAHIQRLRDDDPESEEITELITERSEKVAEIKERYPYPVDPNNN